MKRSITSKIIISYLAIIFISLSFADVLFNFAAQSYMEKKVVTDLFANADIIIDAYKMELFVSGKKAGNEADTVQNRVQPLIRGIVEKGMESQEISFAVITKNLNDYKAVFPGNTGEAEVFKARVLPEIEDKLIMGIRSYFKTWIDKKEYIGVFSPIGIDTGGWVILYTPVKLAYDFGRNMLLILLVSISFTGLLAVISGIFFARSIAKPVIKLKKRAELLSKRDFDTRVEVETGDELEELANTIDKMAAELKEYDMAQKKFLQNASHELKTPLMSIQGYAEGIKDGVFENNEQALNIIAEESTRLKNIVEELIFLSKLETMEDFYKFTDESINEIIEKSVEKVNGLALKSSIRISRMLYKDAHTSVDKDKLTEALINIIGNCIRYARSEIKITTFNDGKYFEVRINDDGEGFDEKEIKNIFQRFYKGKKGDTGLGLAITKVIIEKHGGSIEAANGETGGAEFKIRLKIG